MANTKGAYPFAEKEKQYRRATDAMLAFARNDAFEAMKVNEGWNEPAACWYADDVHTIAAEMARRSARAAETGMCDACGEAKPVDELAHVHNPVCTDGVFCESCRTPD